MNGAGRQGTTLQSRHVNLVIDHLRHIALAHDHGALTDTQLLECFIARREEAAFEMIVRRYAAMVFGVCRRVLRNTHDAEDAFQATFLVLARKASSIRSRELLAHWLYGVAYQTALKARMLSVKRQARERPMNEMPEPEAARTESAPDWQPVLDQELTALPAKYRVPIVLCDLQGKTRREAAHQLRVPEGTLSTWLARARTALAKRLARHGIAFSGGAIGTALTQDALSAALPTHLLASTVKAATAMAAGKAVSAGTSATVTALAEGVMKTMFVAKLRTIATAVLVVCLMSTGAVALFHVITAISNEGALAAAAHEASQEDKKDSAPLAAEADKARAVIHKAIQAQGGESNLAKQKVLRQKGTFRRFVDESQGNVVVSWEQITQEPDRMKNVQATEIGGQEVMMTTVLHGEQGWVSMNGQLQVMSDEMLASLKDDRYLDAICSLVVLKQKQYDLSVIGETKLSGRAVVGVKVAAKGRDDVNLYFDKENGLLVKRERRVDDGKGGKITEELLFSGYKETDKVKLPRKIVSFADGKRIAEVLIAEVEFLDKIDDSVFARPAEPAPKQKNGGKDTSVVIRQDRLPEAQVDLEKTIDSARARAMKKSGLAGATGGAHVRVLSKDPQEIVLPIPQLGDGQVPLSFFISSNPQDAATEFRLRKNEDGNVVVLVRLAGKKQDVRITWSSVVLLAAKNLNPGRTPAEPFRKASPCVQAQADEIAKIVTQVWPKSGKPNEFAKNIQQHVRGMKRLGQPRSLDALGILKSGENGICTANANLAAAMMRSKGIACRSIAVIPPISRKLEMHRIVEYFDDSRWVPFDPSGLHADIPTKPWQSIIMARTTMQDEQMAMKPRLGVMVGCPHGQEIELLTPGVSLFGQDMFWTMAKPLAEFEPTDECTRLAIDAWTRYLEKGVLSQGQLKVGTAKTADHLVKLLNEK
jgi:RNA polymerase sigma factor (sigma-70 family)